MTFRNKVLIGHDQGKFRHFLHIPVLVLDESNWLNVLSPVQTNISAVWTFFPARRPRQWTKKNMLYHIRDGTYEIKDLSSALLCVVSKINEGTRGSKKGGQIIIYLGIRHTYEQSDQKIKPKRTCAWEWIILRLLRLYILMDFVRKSKVSTRDAAAL